MAMGPASDQLQMNPRHTSTRIISFLLTTFLCASLEFTTLFDISSPESNRNRALEVPNGVIENNTGLKNTTKPQQALPNQKTRETEYVVLENEESTKETELCSPVGECTLCKQDDPNTNCSKTGRVIEYLCISKLGKEEDLNKRRIEYRSCQRTTADEKYLLLKMESIFLFVGILSTMYARLLKPRSVSLFDQRWSKKVRQSSLAFTFQPGMLGVDEDLSSKINKNDSYKDIEPLMNRNKNTLQNRVISSNRSGEDASIHGETAILSSSDHGKRELELV